MKRRAVFFDRDNTLIVSNGYLGNPEQVALVEAAADAVARVRQLGYAVVVVSNQSGVARGYFDEAAVRAVNQRMEELLVAANPEAVIDRHEFCPFHPEATVDAYRQDSFLRKPKPGMFLQAAEKLALDLSRSWVVGDAPRDIEAGKAAGCRTILLADPRLEKSPAADEATTAYPDHVAGNLHEATEFIAAHPEPTPSIEPPVTVELSHVPISAQSPTPAQLVEPTAPPRAELSKVEGQLAKLQGTLEQVLLDLRRAREPLPADFSVSKLLAGIVQVLVLAALFLAYLKAEANSGSAMLLLLLALTLQTMTIALLIMGRQR